MKIVHIITRLILGGAQENTLITCRGLVERGHEVTLITGPAVGPEGHLFEHTRGQGYNVIIVDRLCREINPLWDADQLRSSSKSTFAASSPTSSTPTPPRPASSAATPPMPSSPAR